MSIRTLPFLIAAFLIHLPGVGLQAQYGEPDPGYGTGGFAITDAWQQTLPRTLCLLADGGTVAAGFRFATAQVPGIVRLLKLDAQGAIDGSFGDNGVVTWTHVPNQTVIAEAMVELPDGRLLVAASVTVGFNDVRQLLLRFMPNGALDTGFGDEGVVYAPLEEENVPVLFMDLDAQGRILLCGERRNGTGIFGSSEAYLMRLLADGSMDASFGTDGMVLLAGNYVFASGVHVEVLDDGRLLLLVSVGDLEDAEVRIARLLPDGATDTSFGDNGVALVEAFGEWRPYALRLAVDAGGRIRVGALFEDLDGVGRVGSFALLPDGSLDATYGNNGLALVQPGVGSGEYDFPLAMLVDADGGLLFQVEVMDDEDLIYGWARQLPGGAADEVFAPNGMKVATLPPGGWLTFGAALQDDGKLIALGGVSQSGGGFPQVMVTRVQPTATFASVPEQAPFLSGLTLFPNPVADRFTLAFHHDHVAPLRIELMDLQGRLVHRFAERPFPQGEQRLELAWPGDAAQGAYVLAITGAAGRVAVPLMR